MPLCRYAAATDAESIPPLIKIAVNVFVIIVRFTAAGPKENLRGRACRGRVAMGRGHSVVVFD